MSCFHATADIPAAGALPALPALPRGALRTLNDLLAILARK